MNAGKCLEINQNESSYEGWMLKDKRRMKGNKKHLRSW